MKMFKRTVYVGFQWDGHAPCLEGYTSVTDTIKVYAVFRTKREALCMGFESVKKCYLEEI